MPKERLTGPSGSALTLVEAKSHLSVDFSDDDALITGLIEAATLAVENYLMSPIRTETWRHWFSSLTGALILADPRIRSIDALKYYDTSDGLVTVSVTDYIKDTVSRVKLVALKATVLPPALSAERAYPVYVDVTTGYATVPDDIKVAIKSLIGTLYANRESDVIGEGTVAASMDRNFGFLLKPYRARYI